ncbi:hypothetical protein MRX96_050007 [Rhipicephalus microplus]
MKGDIGDLVCAVAGMKATPDVDSFEELEPVTAVVVFADNNGLAAKLEPALPGLEVEAEGGHFAALELALELSEV